jgi:hypothetical protein
VVSSISMTESFALRNKVCRSFAFNDILARLAGWSNLASKWHWLRIEALRESLVIQFKPLSRDVVNGIFKVESPRKMGNVDEE